MDLKRIFSFLLLMNGFFSTNQNQIVNNLSITNKQYFIIIYIENVVYQKVNNTQYYFEITLQGEGINRNFKTASTSASLTGTTNTTNGISNTYVGFLTQVINLLYHNFSLLPGFQGCSAETSLTSFNAINNVGLTDTNVLKFSFDILNLAVQRQRGQTLDVFVTYRYKNTYQLFDYKVLRQYIIDVLTSTVDENSYWEYLSAFLAQTAYHQYPELEGITIQILAKSNPSGDIPEPGDHGPIYTYGVM
jgi:hypothetical protein